MSAGKVLIGVLAGVAVGATLGILMAPDKGANTRKKISKSGEDFMDNMKAKLAGIENEIKKVKSKALKA